MVSYLEFWPVYKLAVIGSWTLTETTLGAEPSLETVSQVLPIQRQCGRERQAQ